MNKRMKQTDWTEYYRGKRSWFSTFTQKFTLEKIIECINDYTECQVEKIKILELGGGNSCFAENICRRIPTDTYDIVDNNELSVALFSKQKIAAKKTEGFLLDLLSDDNGKLLENTYDFVFSVGLIEHFRGRDIDTIINKHFLYCKKGGTVMITFPTPTLKYRFIRKAMEMLHVWRFWDEKPLNFEAVRDSIQLRGSIEKVYINKKLPLTQMVVIARKI